MAACMLAAPALSQESSAPTLTVVKPASKVCQLIGDVDRESMTPTLNQTFSRYGLAGTDLGASFEHAGKVWFLFGDSQPASGNPTCGDSVATSMAPDASTCIPLRRSAPRCLGRRLDVRVVLDQLHDDVHARPQR